MNQPVPPTTLDAEQVNELARCFWYSAILRAGIKLDVFARLEAEEMSWDQLAQRIGAAPRYIQAFLDSCAALGLLEANGDKYRTSPLCSRFLVKGKEEYVGDHALHHTNTWDSWGRLDELIMEGAPLRPYETGFVDEPTYWTNYMVGQHNRATSGQARQLVENVDLSNRHTMLDLGGGAASYSIALCSANPHLKAVVVDQKEPLAIARPLVAEHGLEDRVSFLEGSFFETDLGSGYDVALVSGVVLISSEETCRRLFELTYRVLKPGGMVIIQDYMRVDHHSARSKLDTLEDMYVLVAFDAEAGNREGEEVASWLQDAGFRNHNMIGLPTQLALVISEKPDDP